MSNTNISDLNSSAWLSNPFSSRHIRPGAQPYIFPANDSIDHCVARLRQYGRSQIVGPHGAGKSTLMRDIIRVWVEKGGAATLLRIGPRRRVEERLDWELCNSRSDVSDVPDVPDEMCVGGQRSISARSSGVTGLETLVCVDGWDGWPWWRRVACRWKFGARNRLLVTTHVANRWPILFEPQTELTVFRCLVAQLQGDSQVQASHDEIDSAYFRSEGNVREALFALYDVIQRKSQSPNSSLNNSMARK